jgi:hypothetical protein
MTSRLPLERPMMLTFSSAASLVAAACQCVVQRTVIAQRDHRIAGQGGQELHLEQLVAQGLALACHAAFSCGINWLMRRLAIGNSSIRIGVRLSSWENIA